MVTEQRLYTREMRDLDIQISSYQGFKTKEELAVPPLQNYWFLPRCLCCNASTFGMGDAEFCSIECELIYEAEMDKYQDTPSEEFPANHAAHLPKGWSHIMHVLDLNEEETSTPSYGPFSRWDGTYNWEHDSEEYLTVRPIAKAMAVARQFL